MASCDDGGKVIIYWYISMYCIIKGLHIVQVAIVGMFSAKGNTQSSFDQPIKVYT